MKKILSRVLTLLVSTLLYLNGFTQPCNGEWVIDTIIYSNWVTIKGDSNNIPKSVKVVHTERVFSTVQNSFLVYAPCGKGEDDVFREWRFSEDNRFGQYRFKRVKHKWKERNKNIISSNTDTIIKKPIPDVYYYKKVLIKL